MSRTMLVDGTDYAVLVALLERPTAPWDGIGDHIGRSGTTVAQRIARLEETDVYRGLRLLPDPRFLGREAFEYLVGPEAPVRAPDDLPDALCSTGYEDGSWAYTVAPRPDDHDAVVQALARVLGPARSMARVDLRRSTGPIDPLLHALSPIDWRILRALVLEPRMALSALAERTRLTRRTVQRHRDELLERGKVVTVPLLRAAPAPGVVLHHLRVFGTTRGETLRAPHRFPYVRFTDPPGTGLLCMDETVADAHATAERVRALPGVTHVLSKVPVTNRVAEARLVTWLDAEVARWDGARRRRT